MSFEPKISIISPSFNCVALVRHSIESVLAQGYSNIEHIIVDGASTDGTVEVLKSYPHLRWISEPDKGEAEALNKALRMVTGDIVTWLNVDDQYVGSDIYRCVVQRFHENPACDMVYGKGISVDSTPKVLWYRRPFIDLTVANLMRWFANPNLFQPAMFYRRRLVDTVGAFRENLHYGIDYEYWLRTASLGFRASFVDTVFAQATLVREGAKSQGSFEDQHLCWMEIAREYERYLSPEERLSYWRDFWFFRIRPPVEYTHELKTPAEPVELHGFIIAALELGHLPLAIQGIERLGAVAPELPETYFLLSEILQRTGNQETAAQAFQHAVGLTHKAASAQS